MKWYKMFEARELECLRGERRLFSGVSFVLEAGQMLYVQGKNGAGKTSLLRILSGLVPAASGEVWWRGQPVRKHSEAFRAELCYLGHLNAIKEELSPLENLLIGARFSGVSLTPDAAMTALAQVGLASRADLSCRYLSQGQKRRVALARLVFERRALWILDEPYVALDSAAVAFVAGLLSAQLQRGGSVVLTTHQQVDVPAAQWRSLLLGAPHG